MSEFWLIVTLCAVPTLGDADYDMSRPVLSSECVEYRVDSPFPSIPDCRLHQVQLNSVPMQRRRLMASLCTARLSPARLGELPLLSATLGDPA